MNKSEAPVRDAEKIEKETEEKSSQLLDLMNLKGKVTGSGARLSLCEDHPSGEKVIQTRHPWSVYGAPNDELRKAMDRIRKKLPENGWKIVKDGPDGSVSKSPQIVADSTDKGFSADIRLLLEPEVSDKTSLIEVTVVSTCFRNEKQPTTATPS